MKKNFVWTGLLLGVACACLAQSQPQSLADLARQKKPAKKAVLVLSDDDLPPSARSTDANDDSGPAAADTSSDADNKPDSRKKDATDDKDKADKKDKDEPASKDQRTNELKQKLASYQKEEQAWQKAAKHNEDLLENETSDFRRQSYQDALDNDKHNAAMYQQKIDEVQNELNKEKSSQDSAHSDTTKPDGSQP